MRFEKKDIETGAKRTIWKFAIFPITIGKETRWLEKVTIQQTYVRSGCSAGSFSGWSDDTFVDYKECKETT